VRSYISSSLDVGSDVYVARDTYVGAGCTDVKYCGPTGLVLHAAVYYPLLPSKSMRDGDVDDNIVFFLVVTYRLMNCKGISAEGRHFFKKEGNVSSAKCRQ
jgi:hypothetical protein